MSKYLPRGLKLLDPRAMRQEDIVKIFKHISTRQISHGVRDAFRFKAVMTSRKGSNLDKTHYIDPLANPALLVMDPLDTEPNPPSPSGHVPALPSAYSDLNPAPTYEPVPALPPVQRVFTSVFSIGDPSAIGGQSNPPEVTPNLTANTTRTARGRPEQHAFDNAGDDNQETTQRRPRPLDKTHYIDPLANPALLVMDPLDTEPNPASPSGHVPALPSAYSDLNPAPTYEPVPALPPVQRVFTSVFSIGDPSAIGGQSNPLEVTPNLTANTTRTARGRPEHAFDNAGDDNQETTERRPRPRPRPTARGGKKVQGHASENASHTRETPRPERQALTFDPGHQWESNYDLDPSLDPAVALPSTSNTTELLTPSLTLTTDGSSVQTHTPTPAKSPRRKADMLAIDEAQSLIVKGKRRR